MYTDLALLWKNGSLEEQISCVMKFSKDFSLNLDRGDVMKQVLNKLNLPVEICSLAVKDKIAAIKKLRDMREWSLAESKHAVDIYLLLKQEGLC